MRKKVNRLINIFHMAMRSLCLINVSVDFFIENPSKEKPQTDPEVQRLSSSAAVTISMTCQNEVFSKFAGGLPVCHMFLCF